MEKISDNKRRNIDKARAFALKCISGKTNSYSIDDYYTLQISKFLLLKESIIKKNPQTNTIHFNYSLNNNYLRIIKRIVKLFDNDKLVLNNINVSIEPKRYENEELKRVLLIFNKIRDALAHGAYEIDINRQEIVIYNHSDELGNSYHIEGRLPISLLEEFSYSGLSPDIINIILNGEKKLFNVNVNRDAFIKKTEYELKTESQLYNEIYRNVNFINEEDIIENHDDKKLFDNTNINYKSALKIVKTLLTFISDSKDIADDTKRIAYELAEKVLNNPKYKDALEGIDKDLAKYKKIRELINELCRLLDTGKNEIGIKNVAIYNYIQMYLSNCLELNEEQKKKIRYLRLRELKCNFIRNNDIDIQIKGTVKLILKQYRKRLKQCVNNPDPSSFYKVLADFHDATLNMLLPLFQSRNVSIITNIRNAVDHGNITFDGENVTLTDSNDLESDKFTCSCTSDQLFRVINDLDTTKEEDLEYDELSIICSELEPILSDDESLYKEFYEAVRFYYRNRIIKQLEEIKAKK